MITIVTPRPPLNLFEVSRAQISDSWVTLYDVPRYQVPASGPTPARFVLATAIITGLAISNPGEVTIDVSIQAIDANGNARLIANEIAVFPNDFATVGVDRQVLLSGEKLQLKTKNSTQTAVVHMSFILNQREEYEVIV